MTKWPELGVWLINLDRSTERRAAMEQRLARIGIKYVRFPAIDGQSEWDQLLSDVDMPTFRRNVGRDVLPGEIGCFASHLAVWQALIDGPHEVALVLEDDVNFNSDFLSALDLLMTARGSWDMVKLNKVRAKQPVQHRKLGDYRLNSYLGSFTGMGAYVITSSFAMAQITKMRPFRRPIDHVLDQFDAKTFRHFGLEPFPSHTDSLNHSTITGVDFAAIHKYPWYRRFYVFGYRIAKPWKKMLGIFAFRIWQVNSILIFV